MESYHIYYDSPCRDAGCDSAGAIPLQDIDCLPCVVGPDMPGVESDLANSGCKVYISLYDTLDGNGNSTDQPYVDQYLSLVNWTGPTDALRDVYYGLDVSGAFDTVNTSGSGTIYEFDKLESQIMANWPAYRREIIG